MEDFKFITYQDSDCLTLQKRNIALLKVCNLRQGIGMFLSPENSRKSIVLKDKLIYINNNIIHVTIL